jgi:hypothetical protein
MRTVFSVNDIPWQNLRGLPGARGFEYKALSDNDYSSAFNAELVRLEPGDHSVPHSNCGAIYSTSLAVQETLRSMERRNPSQLAPSAR